MCKHPEIERQESDCNESVCSWSPMKLFAMLSHHTDGAKSKWQLSPTGNSYILTCLCAIAECVQHFDSQSDVILESRVQTRPRSQVSQPNCSAGSCLPLRVAKVKQQRRGDKPHRHDARLLKRGGRKNLSLPTDLNRLSDYLCLNRKCSRSNRVPMILSTRSEETSSLAGAMLNLQFPYHFRLSL